MKNHHRSSQWETLFNKKINVADAKRIRANIYNHQLQDRTVEAAEQLSEYNLSDYIDWGNYISLESICEQYDVS